jgi:RimJ/RimL family protein N-acetyltransferase
VTRPTPTVRLRPTSEADLPFVFSAENDPANTPFVRQWTVEEHRAALADPDIRHWIIEVEGDARPVGYLIAMEVESGRGRVTLRRLVVTEPGRGFGRQALRQFHRLAFGALGAAKVRLIVYAGNHRAQRL